MARISARSRWLAMFLVAAVAVALAVPSGISLMIVVVVFFVLFFEGVSRAVWLVSTTISVRAAARRARESWRPRDYLVPRTLPPVPESLVGRAAELDALRAHVTGLPQDHPPAVVVISGEPGVGRTTLALRLAHEIADRYPDGQVYANLECTEVEALDRGRTTALSDGLAVLVKALDTPWGTVPAGFGDRVAAYRRRAAGKRLLIVLDNAPDEEELPSLLPPGAGSVAIITSTCPVKHVDGAVELALGPLPEREAITLLEKTVGDGQLEPDLAARLVRACDHHPLAIRLVGIALAPGSGTDLTTALDLMTSRSTAVPVESSLAGVLDGAYATLTADERAALRCLGTMNKAVFAPWMFVAASGIERRNCTVLVDRLIRAQLLTEISGTSRRSPLYRLSPAVLEYARCRAEHEDEDVVGARVARLTKERQRRRERSNQLDRALRTAESGDLADAITMVREEMFSARDRDDRGTEARANALLADLYTELGYLVDAREAIDLALGFDDPPSAAIAHRVSGKIAYRQRRLADATKEFDDALDLAVRADEFAEVARVHGERAIGFARAERFSAAHADADRAARLCRERGADQPLPLCRALHAKATVHFYQNQPEEAERVLVDARSRLGGGAEHLLSRAWLRQALARVALAGDRTDEAVTHATEGLELFVRMRHRYGVAHCRSELGRAFVARGQDDAAIDAFREALTIFRDCGGDWVEGRVSLELAACHRGRGQHDRAAHLEARAAEVFAAVGDGDLAVQAARGLAFPPLRRNLRQQFDSVSD